MENDKSLFDKKDEEEINNPTEPSGMYLKAENFIGDGLRVQLAEKARREAIAQFNNKVMNIFTMQLENGNIMELTTSDNLAKELMKTHTQVGDYCRIKSEKVEYEDKQTGETKYYWKWSAAKLIDENESPVKTKEEDELISVDSIPF